LYDIQPNNKKQDTLWQPPIHEDIIKK